MARINQVSESFLDGFGCLAAIFEPVVRPGSMENLIQQDLEPLPIERFPTLQVDRRETGELVGWVIASAVLVLSSVALSLLPSSTWVEWSLRVSAILAISVGTLFLRAAVRVLAPILSARSKGSRTPGAKASHGV